MHKGVMGFVKGMGTGIAAGVAVGAIGSTVLSKNKKAKRNASKALKSMGQVINNVQHMMRY